MRRETRQIRPDWRQRTEAIGFHFAEIDGQPCWDESACWRFDADEIDVLDDATAELQRLCLLAAWLHIECPGGVHFACQRDSIEDRSTVAYLRDTAMQSGLDVPFLHIDDIGWNGTAFVDLDNRPIRTLFKLYPWEWLLRDSFGNNIGPAFREPGRTGGTEIVKPLWGREGANIRAPGVQPPGPDGADGFVHQGWAELPRVDGRYAVIGSWLIESVPRGIGIREDNTPITRDTSRFVPHYFAPRDGTAGGG